MIQETGIIPEYLNKRNDCHVFPKAYWSVLTRKRYAL